MVAKNPCDDVRLPKKEKKRQEIWTVEIIRKALDNCSDGKLFVAINLSFACSLRMGEITGLTWDCVHITDDDIARDDAYIIIDKELARVSQDAIQAIGEKDILFMFPRITKAKSTTRLVLKRPKTETSVRKVWLPKTLAYILRDWKQKQDKLKEFMGEEYSDYNLVLALETGRPCDDCLIGTQFERLKPSDGLRDVVLQLLTHSRTPYKTKLKGTTPYFYVRQVLKMKDSIGNFVSIRLNARTASRKSCQLPAVEHAYQVGELMEIASARIARTYIIGSTKYTRLTHVKLHIPTG